MVALEFELADRLGCDLEVGGERLGAAGGVHLLQHIGKWRGEAARERRRRELARQCGRAGAERRRRLGGREQLLRRPPDQRFEVPARGDRIYEVRRRIGRVRVDREVRLLDQVLQQVGDRRLDEELWEAEPLLAPAQDPLDLEPGDPDAEVPALIGDDGREQLLTAAEGEEPSPRPGLGEVPPEVAFAVELRARSRTAPGT